MENMLGQVFPLSGYQFAGIACLLLAAFARNRAVDRLNATNEMRQPITTVHDVLASPVEQVRAGTVGCLLGWPLWGAFWILLFMGGGLFLFQEAYWFWLIDLAARVAS